MAWNWTVFALWLSIYACCNLRAVALSHQDGSADLSETAAFAAPLLVKRGTGWGLNATHIRKLQGLSWWYNWGPSAPDSQAARAGDAVGMHFVPEQWGRWGIGSLASNIQPGSTVLLTFNEPNHQEQSGMTPQEAADLWPQLEAVADKLGLRLGAPAAAPRGAQCIIPSPFDWWDAFFLLCKGCRVDFLVTHYYSCNARWLEGYLRQCRKYQLPIWLKEFACPNPGGADTVSLDYMRLALGVLDQDKWVEKYAWFALETSGWLGTSNSLMNLTTGTLTELGNLYLGHIPSGPGNEGAAKPDEAGGASWTELCRPCMRHVGSGGLLAGLSPGLRRYCGQSCGFWDRNAVH